MRHSKQYAREVTSDHAGGALVVYQFEVGRSSAVKNMISVSRIYKRLSPTTKILLFVPALTILLIFTKGRDIGGTQANPLFVKSRGFGENAIKNGNFEVIKKDVKSISTLEAGENKASLKASTVEGDTDNSLRRRLPNVHIMGAMKSGTEALHTFLGVHPDVLQAPVMSLAFCGINNHGLDWYLEQMPLSGPDQATMTIQGGWDPQAPQRARMFYKFNKDLKLIMILRDPVKRAISHFSMWHSLNAEWKNKSIEEAIYEPGKPGIINTKVPVIHMGMYYEGLLPYLQYFPLKQILIVDAAAFIKDPLSELIKLEAGLELPRKFNSSLFYYNEKRRFYCYVKQGVNRCMPGGKGRKHVEVKESTMNDLRRFYRPHNENFYVLFNRTFDWQ